MNWSAFFSMGGYGLYVWGSYLTAAVILIANIVLPLRAHRSTAKRLRRTSVAQNRNR